MYNIQYPSYLEIATGDSNQFLLLLRGLNRRHQLSYWIELMNPDKKVFFHELLFTSETEHDLTAHIDLNQKINLSKDRILEVRIPTNPYRLQYRWIDKGIPTVTVIIRDEDLVKAGLPMPNFRVKMLN